MYSQNFLLVRRREAPPTIARHKEKVVVAARQVTARSW